MRAAFDDNCGLKYAWLYGGPTKIYLDSFPRWTDFDKDESKDLYY